MVGGPSGSASFVALAFLDEARLTFFFTGFAGFSTEAGISDGWSEVSSLMGRQSKHAGKHIVEHRIMRSPGEAAGTLHQATPMRSTRAVAMMRAAA